MTTRVRSTKFQVPYCIILMVVWLAFSPAIQADLVAYWPLDGQLKDAAPFGQINDDGQFVGDSADVRKQVTDRHPTLTTAVEGPGTADPLPVLVGRRIGQAGGRFSVVFVEGRLGVETVDVRDAAVHEAEDDVLGSRGVVADRRRSRGRPVGQQAGQGHGTESVGRLLQPLPPG